MHCIECLSNRAFALLILGLHCLECILHQCVLLSLNCPAAFPIVLACQKNGKGEEPGMSSSGTDEESLQDDIRYVMALQEVGETLFQEMPAELKDTLTLFTVHLFISIYLLYREF